MNTDLKIKIFGIGGGGINAVSEMENQNMTNVELTAINTDAQSLSNSSVSNKLQIGEGLTEGLGSGADPRIGLKAAIESQDDIINLIGNDTDIIFLVAGLGGGTGTGALGHIGEIAKKQNILTIAVVTIPFRFEGQVRKKQALKAIENVKSKVDSTIIIDSNKLTEIYGNLGFKAGFSKLNKTISDLTTGFIQMLVPSSNNITRVVDLRDLTTSLKDSTYSTYTFGSSGGEDRANKAIEKTFKNPLLNSYNLSQTTNILLYIVIGKNEITIDEIGTINDYIQNMSKGAKIIMGISHKEELEDEIEIQLILSGFELDSNLKLDSNLIDERIVHVLDSSSNDSLSLYVLEEEYTSAEISELISFVSDLYREIGGDGLVIKGMDILEIESVLEPVM